MCCDGSVWMRGRKGESDHGLSSDTFFCDLCVSVCPFLSFFLLPPSLSLYILSSSAFPHSTLSSPHHSFSSFPPFSSFWFFPHQHALRLNVSKMNFAVRKKEGKRKKGETFGGRAIPILQFQMPCRIAQSTKKTRKGVQGGKRHRRG